MEFDEIISIGGSCDSAHHIRRYFTISKSMPMDWLILPFDALISLCNDNFSDFISIDRLALFQGTRHALQCAKRGIVFQHDFPRDGQAMVKVEEIEIAFDAIKRKYARRIARLRQACQPGRTVLFVRSWREILHAPPDYPEHCIRGVPDYQFKKFLSALAFCFPNITFKVLFINYGAQSIDDPRSWFADIRNSGDIVDWTGSNGGWDEVFVRYDIRLRAQAGMLSKVA